MEHTAVKAYPYRWIILLAFMLPAAFNQLLWITFAPITSTATTYYGVSDLDVGLLSLCFMVAYLVVSIPASWVIDTYGFRISVTVGAVLTGVFGLLRGMAGPNYNLALVAQIGIAIGQPFIVNAITKVAARWFPSTERATASGLGSLAMYVGILAGMVLTPVLSLMAGMTGMLMIYGAGSLLAAIVFVALARERPLTAPGPADEEVRVSMLVGLRQVIRKKNFLLLMLIFFLGLGVFNSVTTWIEDIVRPRGFSISEAGVAGGLLILGGVIGAVILPALSDRSRRRVPYLVGAVAGAAIGLVGITFAGMTWLLYLSALILGFFLLSSGPIGFQYGAEIARPTPEGTSTGLLLMMGQLAGILFIFGMDSFRDASGAMTPSLIAMIVLMIAGLVLATRLQESTLLKT